jgi:glucose dehydrogenase
VVKPSVVEADRHANAWKADNHLDWSGVMAVSQEFYVRASDVRTGKELCKGRLPVGAQATPMTCVSPKSGRQFVVIVRTAGT